MLLPAITTALGGADEATVAEALDALAGLGDAATAQLIEFLKYPRLRSRALARIDPDCERASSRSVPLLIRALEQTDPRVRLEAASSLRYFGTRAKDAVPALKRALDDKDPLVRDTAREALQAIQRQQAKNGR